MDYVGVQHPPGAQRTWISRENYPRNSNLVGRVARMKTACATK